MRNIAVITGTRAEYGVLYNTIRKIEEDEDLKLQLIVTGNHLVEEYGMSVDQIIQDGFDISDKVDIIMSSRETYRIAKSTSIALGELSKAYDRLGTDIVIVLGDRYEMLAAATAAMLMNIPIAHISGGEITEGAQDDQIRHAITKMANLHFPGARVYGDNIVNMGEEDWRVFEVGDPGIENIKNMKFLNQSEIKRQLGILIDRKTLLATFHPVTLELDNLSYQIKNFLDALEESERKIVLTYPNADMGSEKIIEEIVSLSKRNKNIKVFKNLGGQMYLSIMKLCGAVVGNSSSAIIEAPYLSIPSINIGSRQEGRLTSKSVIQCGYDKRDILRAIEKSLNTEFREECKRYKSLYGEGNTSEKIVDVLKSISIDEKLLKKKLVWS